MQRVGLAKIALGAFAFCGATEIAIACGPPKAAGTRADVAAPKFSPGPWAASLAQACTPRGPEQCFNATDDNCNGVIDEGCGICTGPLQFTIAWADPAAEVELSVVDPTGAKVEGGRSATPSGLKLDRDCPKDGCGGQNVKNICSESTDPPRGRYVMEVKLGSKPGAVTPSMKVRVGVRINDRSYGADLDLSPVKDQETISFVL